MDAVVDAGGDPLNSLIAHRDGLGLRACFDVAHFQCSLDNLLQVVQILRPLRNDILRLIDCHLEVVNHI